MGRIIPILTAACLVATFLIISNSSFKSATSAPPKDEEVNKKVEKGRARKKEQDSRTKIGKKGAMSTSPAHSANTPKDGSGVFVVMSEEENNQQDLAHAIVKGDSTPVYSVNSRDSSIVRLLKKGDSVATDLEVIDAKGKWTIVRRGDLVRPGFVLDENLQRGNANRRIENRNTGKRE